MTRGTPVEVISNSYDAFQRLRVSMPYTLFDSKLIFSANDEFWDNKQVSGTGTSIVYNTNKASITMRVSENTIGKRVRQSYHRCVYQPGKSQLVMITANFQGYQDGVIKRFGYFDEKNGVYFQASNGVISVGLRTNVSGTVEDKIVPQSEWNECRMNTDDSDFDIDPFKANIFWICFEWLGVGNIFYGVVINGKHVLLHQWKNANNIEYVYMSSPNLPIRSEIENTGTGPSASLTLICSQVSSEGGIDPSGVLRTFNRGSQPITITNVNVSYPLLALRLKQSCIGSIAYPININVLCTSSANFLWRLLRNPTLTGATLNYISNDYFACEYCATSTTATVVTGGFEVMSGYCAIDASGQADIPEIPNKIIIGSSIDNVSDVYVVSITKIGKNGAADDFYGSMMVRVIV